MATTQNILMTATARCRDCYRCVRACPVKAIGIQDNQAYIDTDRCILCGTCVRECPQGAKVFRNDVEKVKALLEKGNCIASIAPSFSGVYSGWKSFRLPSALRKLGFIRIEETSVGADAVASYSREKLDDIDFGGVCSACPAVVSYMEHYMPDEIGMLMQTCSPMIAHAQMIKQMHPQATVVFIGPCIAKKAEAEQSKFTGIIDAVLTFSELDHWLAEECIDLQDCPDSAFDSTGNTNAAKLFALPGGMLETAGIPSSISSHSVIHVSGASDTTTVLHAAVDSQEMEVIEPLFCSGGCIAGPGISAKTNLFERRASILQYARSNHPPTVPSVPATTPKLETAFTAYPVFDNDVSEQQILEVFERTGKAKPELRLDCGACGYVNCRQNAIAVIGGRAEPEMCIPYMRRLAESRTDKIIESSPNGIVLLDENLCIQSMNSSFKHYFTCNNSILGRKISYLLSSSDYQKIANGDIEKSESIIHHYGKELHQIIYYLPEEQQYVGIYMDVSGIKLNEAKIEQMRENTVKQVQKLMEHQIEMAQKMTMFLGESTAQSESLLEGLMNSDE